jgi:hypothetical protein
MPMSGQVAIPTVVGTVVVLLMVPTCVVDVGVVERVPLEGTKTTAVAEPGLPQP